MRNRKGSYDLKFKLKVISEVETGKESAMSALAKYGIGGSMTIYRWIAQKKSGKLTGNTEAMSSMSQ